MRNRAACGLFLILISGALVAKEQTRTWVSVPKELTLDGVPPGQRAQWFDAQNAKLFSDHVVDLIAKTIGPCKGYNAQGQIDVHPCHAKLDDKGQPVGNSFEQPNFPGPSDYVIIHVLRWNDLVAGKTSQTVDKQNWYVFNSQSGWDDNAFSKNNRIFGKKQIYLLYIHFNRDSNALYNVRYELKAASKLPAFLDHFVKLGQLAGIGTVGGAAPAAAVDVWNAHLFEVDYVPSDLTVTPTIQPTGQAEFDLDAKTFDNEGKYHTDFSVGVPITKLSQLSFASSSNSLVPTKVDQQNLFALFDYYPKAFDIKTSEWSPYPHVVAGVAMASKPLQKSLLGIGYGPIIAHFYAGVLIHTQRLPKGIGCGSSLATIQQAAGATLANKTCPEFSFGLNVAAGAIADMLKSKAK